MCTNTEFKFHLYNKKWESKHARAWGHMSMIAAFWRLRQEGLTFKVTLSYIASPKQLWAKGDFVEKNKKETKLYFNTIQFHQYVRYY